MSNEIVLMLDQLAEVRAQEVVTRMDYDKKRAEILAKVQEELDELDAEFKPTFQVIAETCASLEERAKAQVLLHGASVKGAQIHAVYAKGRAGGWDADALKGYAAAHPEILQFKNPDGEPSVSFRAVK